VDRANTLTETTVAGTAPDYPIYYRIPFVRFGKIANSFAYKQPPGGLILLGKKAIFIVPLH